MGAVRELPPAAAPTALSALSVLSLPHLKCYKIDIL